MKLALIQLEISRDKQENLNRAEKLIVEASSKASIVALPEMFICPYNAKTFHMYAEYDGEETTMWLADLSQRLNITLIGGSVPEKDDENMYNTCYVYHCGKRIGKHRKMHMFDVDIKGGITFKESDVLKAGDAVTVVDNGEIKIGIGICYDLRFPEMFLSMVDQGVELIVVPAAFNTITGPAHWHLTTRSRAVDNQVYFAVVSPARSTFLSYKAYGHSLICNPWGEILDEADIEEAIVYADIDQSYVKKVREELPLLQHRKKDVYTK